MASHQIKDHSAKQRQTIEKFKGLLLRRGNKERALTSVTSLFGQLKKVKAGNSITAVFPSYALKENSPINILDKCLYNLKPAFLLRPIIIAGKRFQLPVPISENRAKFVAIDWLRKAAGKNNKNALTIVDHLTREIGASLNQTGSAYEFLKAHINIALDQRPFSRFIKRRRKKRSKSLANPASRRLYKYSLSQRRRKRNLNRRTYYLTKKIAAHTLRLGGLAYRKKRKEKKKNAIKYRKYNTYRFMPKNFIKSLEQNKL